MPLLYQMGSEAANESWKSAGSERVRGRAHAVGISGTPFPQGPPPGGRAGASRGCVRAYAGVACSGLVAGAVGFQLVDELAERRGGVVLAVVGLVQEGEGLAQARAGEPLERGAVRAVAQ